MKVTANTKDNFFTIETEEAIYRTFALSSVEFKELQGNSPRQWQSFLEHSKSYTVIKRNKDLFKEFQKLPTKVKNVLLELNSDENSYTELERVLNNLIKLGYKFEYGLDGIPFNLQKVKKVKLGKT